MDRKCNSCAYLMPEEDEQGVIRAHTCHRNPPVVVHNDLFPVNLFSGWPEVFKIEKNFCGEWEPRL